jgi:hypothetical protein
MTALAASAVEFEILRCRLPIIWLDTSVLIKRAQIKAGVNIGQLDRARVLYLHENIYRLVRGGQLLCPEANQQSEIWRNRDALSAAINEHSLGVYASHPRLVQDRQEQRAMRGYALGVTSLAFPCSDLFSFDPIKRLKENLSQPLFITIVETPSSELIEQMVKDRTSLNRDWEALRIRLTANKVGYSFQLGVELQGEMSTIFAAAQDCKDRMERGEEPTHHEFGCYSRVLRMLAQWDGLMNRNMDVAGLRAFLASDNYFVTPNVFISAALTAALLTRNRPIRSGDAKDVEHISLILPYADLIIVDRYMKHLVCDLGLDRRFGTTVCHLGDMKEFQRFFDHVQSVEPIVSERAMFSKEVREEMWQLGRRVE